MKGTIARYRTNTKIQSKQIMSWESPQSAKRETTARAPAVVNVSRGIPSAELAADWRPYIETCIAAFGPDRGMFESNFPPDGVSSSYAVLWNAFKRLAAGSSADEKGKLFSGTAKRVYRLT